MKLSLSIVVTKLLETMKIGKLERFLDIISRAYFRGHFSAVTRFRSIMIKYRWSSESSSNANSKPFCILVMNILGCNFSSYQKQMFIRESINSVIQARVFFLLQIIQIPTGLDKNWRLSLF